MIDFFRTGIVIQNDVTIVIDAASLTECYLLSRVLPLEIGIIRLVQASADIVAENGDGYVFRYVFQKRQRLDADIIVNDKNALFGRLVDGGIGEVGFYRFAIEY